MSYRIWSILRFRQIPFYFGQIPFLFWTNTFCSCSTLLPTPWHRLQLAFVSVQRSEHSRQQPGQKTRYHMLTSSPGYIIISICPNWKLYLVTLKIVYVKINIVFEKYKLVCESDKPQKLCLKSTSWTVNSKFSWNRCAVWSEVTR